MTFKEALQAEINLQGLSVAIIAKASGISKGAIYNILNGTTEEARIRPSTCKAIALACDRELRREADGVEFVEFGASRGSMPLQRMPETSTVALSWMQNRLFLSNRHCGSAFDWLQKMEVEGRLAMVGVVDRIYQNRPDFLSLAVHNNSAGPVNDVRLRVSVSYRKLPHTFPVSYSETISPGSSSEMTVFLCDGDPFELSVSNVEHKTDAGEAASPVLLEPFRYSGGYGD